eukprot:CAMPEP_0115004912 /NCGR_PEP_ID=MMETSP0216-20121206/19540_1 /TAXON_ID=223996 /ORGANISM="Protocruzia adherens, Strain Boccale" /LENGTH=135 /DNA_ID=CAMNT_0002371101 /DNA_START=119 /DNA_END=522 /DNA_ORIENTATION=-
MTDTSAIFQLISVQLKTNIEQSEVELQIQHGDQTHEIQLPHFDQGKANINERLIFDGNFLSQHDLVISKIPREDQSALEDWPNWIISSKTYDLSLVEQHSVTNPVGELHFILTLASNFEEADSSTASGAKLSNRP